MLNSAKWLQSTEEKRAYQVFQHTTYGKGKLLVRKGARHGRSDAERKDIRKRGREGGGINKRNLERTKK